MNILEASKELIEDTTKVFRYVETSDLGEIQFYCDLYAADSYITEDTFAGDVEERTNVYKHIVMKCSDEGFETLPLISIATMEWNFVEK